MSLQNKNVDLNEKSVLSNELLLYWKIPAFVRWLTCQATGDCSVISVPSYSQLLDSFNKLKSALSFEITENK